MSAIVDTLRAALQTVPDSWQTRLALVEALLGEGEIAEATAVLEHVNELPVDFESQILAARAYGLIDANSGLEVLEHVLASHPDCAKAHFEKAFLCQRARELTIGALHYFTATSLDPSLADPELESSLTGKPAVLPAEKSGTETQSQTFSSPQERFSDLSQVHYPAPGEYPLRTLREALGMAPAPLVRPEDLPASTNLSFDTGPLYQEPIYTPRDQFIAQVEDVELHRRSGQEESVVVYNYEAPDDTIFEPTLSPDDIYVAALTSETGEPVASLQEMILRNQGEVEKTRVKTEKRDRFTAFVTGLTVTVGFLFLAALAIVAIPPPPPPAIVATPMPAVEETLATQKMERPQARPQINQPSASMSSLDFETAEAFSDLSLTSMDSPTMSVGLSDFGMGLGASIDMGTQGGMQPAMFFGSKTTGNLAVVFDITASMYKANPVVVKEINKVFKDAQVVAVFGATFQRMESGKRLIRYKDNEAVLTSVEINGGGGRAKTRDAMNKALFSLRKCDSLEPGKVRGNGLVPIQSLGRAIELLIRQPSTRRPKSIFTFSDFQDGVDPDYLEEICKLAKRHKVKLVFYHPVAFSRDKEKYAAAIKETGVDGEVKEGL